MSIKEQYEFITHEVTERVVTGKTMYCDVCGKEIAKNALYWEVATDYDDAYDFHDYDQEDVCSDTCLLTKFFEYVDSSSKNKHYYESFEVESKINMI